MLGKQRSAAKDMHMPTPGTMAPDRDFRQALLRVTGAGRRALRWWLNELRDRIPSRVRQVFSADPVTAEILLDENGVDVRQILIKGLSNAELSRPQGPLDRR